MLDGIKKNGVYSIIYRGSSVLIVTVLVIGDCDSGACENEKAQKIINFSLHSENQIVSVVITFPEFCSVKLKMLDDKKSGS